MANRRNRGSLGGDPAAALSLETPGSADAEGDGRRGWHTTKLAGTGLAAASGLFGVGMLSPVISSALASGTNSSAADTAHSHSATNEVAGTDENVGTNSVALTDQWSCESTWGIGSKTTQLRTFESTSIGGLFSGRATLSFFADLTSEYGGLSDQCITFRLGDQTCVAYTNSDGDAYCQLFILNTLVPFFATYEASYNGTSLYAASYATGLIKK